MKKISAIVVNWNGKEVLLDCLESLSKQNYSNLEIIVSDNGSEDGSIEAVQEKYPNVLLLENGGNLGFGPAVNKGLEIASGDYFIFLNNDLYLQPDSLKELAGMLDLEPDTGAAIPKILYYEKRDIINSYGVLVHYTSICCPNLVDETDPNNLEPTETACGGIFMFRREIYEKVGAFDPDLFLYHEDHDLSWRIRLFGWKMRTTPKAEIYHHYHFNKGVFKYYSSEKNRLFLLLKNLEFKTLFLISPALFIIEIAQLAHAITNGWFFLKIKSYPEIVDILPRILVKRRKLQRQRNTSDQEISRLYEGNLKISGIQSNLLDLALNPILNCYWKIIRRWI